MSGLGCDRTHGRSGSAQIETNKFQSTLPEGSDRRHQQICGASLRRRVERPHHDTSQVVHLLKIPDFLFVSILIEKCSQIEFDLCIWTYLGRRGTDVICVSAEMRFCLNHYLVKNVSFLRSLPARGVWIEIPPKHPPKIRSSHSPQGECGLKSLGVLTSCIPLSSLPARGVWIEIPIPFPSKASNHVTPRKGSVD